MRKLGYLALGLVLLASCTSESAGESGQTDRSSTTEGSGDIDPEIAIGQLHGASAISSGDEVWVLGGITGEPGLRPPTTSMVPDGWVINRTVTVFDFDGAALRHLSIPDGVGAMVAPAVHRVDGTDYVLGSECGNGLGCFGRAAPVLLRSSGDVHEPVDLAIPPTPSSDVGVGVLTSLGRTGSTVWALQKVSADGTFSPLAQAHRLLRIDLVTLIAEADEIPDDVYPGLLCIADNGLFAGQVDRDASGQPAVGRILTRSAASDGTWAPLTEFAVPPTAGGGSLTCASGSDELLVTISGYPALVRSISSTTGAALAGEATIPQGIRATFVTREGGAVVLGYDDQGQPTFTSHVPGGPWTTSRAPETIERTTLITDGANLFDARQLVEEIGRGSLTPVEIPD